MKKKQSSFKMLERGCKDQGNYELLTQGSRILLVLLCSFLYLSSSARSQTINLKVKNEALSSVLKKIEAQSGLSFWYEDNLLKNAKKVTVELVNTPVKDAIRKCLAGQPLTYSIVNETVVIKRKEEKSRVLSPTLTIPEKLNIDIRGKVTDEHGNALPQISVSVKDIPTKGTSTDENGNYVLSDVAENAILIFSGVGYETKEEKVGSRAVINLKLELKIVAIDEVVITGYQNVDRKMFTGSSSHLLAKDAERVGVPDVSRMLEGQVAGVSVQNVSGVFGAAPKIRVRGATSISGDNKPLWVVDGIILEDVVNISNEQLSTGDANTLIGSSVAGLNADDIESFTILKDAAATAMYGARAMNGVIVVTTKKGKSTQGKPQLSYTSNWTSYLKPTYNDYNIMNSADQVALYLELEEKGYVNHSDIVSASNYGIFGKMYNLFYDVDPVTGEFALVQSPEARTDYLRKAALRNTDWFDILFKNSLLQEHSVSVTTGTDRSQFYASTSFLNDNGWTIVDNVKRYTGNIRGNFKISPKVSIGLLATGSVRNQNSPGSQDRLTNVVSGEYERDFDNNPFSFVMNTSRALAAYEDDGSYAFYQKNYAPYSILHELDNNSLHTNVLDYKLQTEFSWKILSNLKYTFDGAYRFVETNQEHKVTELANAAEAYRAGTEFGIKGVNSQVAGKNRFLWTDPEDPTALPVSVLPYGGFYRRNETSLSSYYMRNSLNWDPKLNNIRHQLNFFGLTELRMADRQRTWSDGVGYQYDKGGVPYFDPNYFKLLSLGNSNYYGMGYEYERYLAYMLRGAYSFDDKYSLNATVRYDGSNKLGISRVARWLPTWNVSGAWNIDQEEFFYNNVKWMDQLRVRATYGLVASMGPATNSSVVFNNANTQRPFFIDRENVIVISSLENAELTWEKQYEMNVGFDAGLLNNRMTITADYYDRKGFDLIGQFRTSGIDGQSTKYANYADMKSHGVELTVQYRIIDQKDLKWDFRGNISSHVSKITNLQNRPRIWDIVRQEGGARVGYPVRSLFSIEFESLGADGLPLFVNESGKGQQTAVNMQSTTLDNLVYSGSIDPKITGGVFSSLTWKGFQLSGLVTFNAGNVVRLSPAFKTRYTDQDASNNALLARWIIYGDEGYTTAPVVVGKTGAGGLVGYPFNNYNYSDIRVASGDFIRLKQVMLNYQLPKSIVSKFWMQNASLAFVANNLWLIYADKKLQGQDPEFFESGGVSLPIQRQLSLSLKLGF